MVAIDGRRHIVDARGADMFRWTGRGWIGLLLWFTLPIPALLLATTTPNLAVWFAVFNVLIGVPVHILVGRAINTPQAPLEHSLQGMPVQRAWFWYPVWSLIAIGAELWTRGHRGAVWVLAVVGLIGLFVHVAWATREYRAAALPQGSPDGEVIASRAVAAETEATPAREKVSDKVFRPDLVRRWAAYGAEVSKLNPTDVTTGTVGEVAFTVFNMTDGNVGLRGLMGSMRTVCMVHLPLALPDLRLRPRLLNEDEIGEIPAVSLEPPWNCDLVVRVRAIDALENDPDPAAGLTVETEVPGFAEALVTPAVVEASVRSGVIHWRVHGPDLIYVSFPGFGQLLSEPESTAVVAGLVQIAEAFPQEAQQRFGMRPAAPA
jgi:hypothetical protein